jgi:hypothetical protein
MLALSVEGSDIRPPPNQISQNLSSCPPQEGPEWPGFFFRADLWRIGPRSGGICFSLSSFLATSYSSFPLLTGRWSLVATALSPAVAKSAPRQN